jgi:hypothetical protein
MLRASGTFANLNDDGYVARLRGLSFDPVLPTARAVGYNRPPATPAEKPSHEWLGYFRGFRFADAWPATLAAKP